MKRGSMHVVWLRLKHRRVHHLPGGDQDLHIEGGHPGHQGAQQPELGVEDRAKRDVDQRAAGTDPLKRQPGRSW
jgi:hypothetical protein